MKASEEIDSEVRELKNPGTLKLCFLVLGNCETKRKNMIFPIDYLKDNKVFYTDTVPAHGKKYWWNMEKKVSEDGMDQRKMVMVIVVYLILH